MYLFIYLYVCVRVYVHVYVYVPMYVRMYVCMYVCMFLYVCMHTYTHTPLHKQTPLSGSLKRRARSSNVAYHIKGKAIHQQKQDRGLKIRVLEPGFYTLNPKPQAPNP